MIVVWTARALDDLQGARTYIEDRNPGAARKTVLRIVEAVASLGDVPGRGRPGRLAGTRELVIPGLPYVVAYRVADGKVEILRVVHSARLSPREM